MDEKPKMFAQIPIRTSELLPENSFMMTTYWKPLPGGVERREVIAWCNGEMKSYTEVRNSPFISNDN